MNTKKGLRRLTVAIGVPYTVGWTLIIVFSLVQLSGCPGWFFGPFNGCENGMSAESGRTFGDLVIKAIFFGYILPPIMWCIFLVARWVYRGFRS